MERKLRKRRILRTTVAAMLALGLLAGCDDDDGSESDGTTTTEAVAVPKATVDADDLKSCLQKETGAVGSPGKDALLAEYSNEAIAEGGASFVIPDPLAQVIVFHDQVDLDETEAQYQQVVDTAGLRAVGLQGDAYGNVLITYFEGTPADKKPATKCLGGEAVPVPGFETPLNPQGPGETPQ